MWGTTGSVETVTVDDAVLRRPKTLGADATAGDVRALLGDHVHAALLVEGRRLVGVVVRADLGDGDSDSDGAGDGAAPDGAPALPLARLEGRTVRSGTPLDDAQRLLAASGLRRLAVVDDTGALVGLLCRKRRGDGWCTDAGVAARRRERTGRSA